MKIALVSQSVTPGFLIFRADFIKYLVLQGHSVYAFATDYTFESRLEVEKLGAIPVQYSLNKSGFNVFQDIRDTWLLMRQFRSIGIDSVFSFFVKPSLYGTLAAKIAKVPKRVAMLEGLGYIHTETKEGFSFKKKLLQYVHGFLATFSYFFASDILFLNKNDAIDLSNKSFLNVRKICIFGPIGLNLEFYPYKNIDLNKPLRFIFIARLLAEKGVFEYLDAARIIKKRHPEVEFVVLGGLDPFNPAALSKQQLDDVIAENLIIYPGHVTDVSLWITEAHVFVLPSYREGFPRSTQEAMAIGRAVITTDVPGCRETVIDGVNGFIVPPYDSFTLAEKMLYLIEHPEEIQLMGDESYRIAKERFDVHKINPILTDILTR